jgi:hypothetical protein
VSEASLASLTVARSSMRLPMSTACSVITMLLMKGALLTNAGCRFTCCITNVTNWQPPEWMTAWNGSKVL